MKNYYVFILFLFPGTRDFAQITARISNGNFFQPNATWTSRPNFGTKGTYFADVTGDGQADAIFVNDENVTVRPSYGNGFFNYVGNNPWTSEPYYGSRGTYIADVNGDGKADAIVVNDDLVTVRISDGYQFLPNASWTSEPYYGSRGTYFADVTGDGRADAIVVNDDLVTVRVSDGMQFLPNASWTSEPYYGSRGTYFADVNGDGKADAIVINDDLITVRISDGTQFLPNASWTSEPYYGTRGTWFADVNGDRKADAIVVNEDLVTVRISDGTQFLPNASWTTEPYYGTKGTYFADVDGDGREDAIVVNDALADDDQDGIPDQLEHNLLEKFRPYFKYSDGESHNPTDCIWYIKLCSGFSDPSSILFSPTDITVTKAPAEGAACIGPDIQQKTLTDNVYAGATWDQVLAAKNIGLYGHVVQVKLTDPDAYDVNHVFSSDDDQYKTFYKVEYWQFYSYNIGCSSSAFDHQGDWTTVQLIIDPDNMQPVVTLHYAHGTIESRFCMNKVTNSEIKTTKEGESVMKYEGPNYKTDLVIDASNGKSIAGTYVNDNELLMFQDPVTNEWSHPVVYVEEGSHEFYPTKAWWIDTCPDHNGDGYSFLANTPPNLGEVENPLNETPFSNIILQFNGKWGCSAGAFNSPPPGPCLHAQWTYPATSSVRWLLAGLGK